ITVWSVTGAQASSLATWQPRRLRSSQNWLARFAICTFQFSIFNLQATGFHSSLRLFGDPVATAPGTDPCSLIWILTTAAATATPTSPATLITLASTLILICGGCSALALTVTLATTTLALTTWSAALPFDLIFSSGHETQLAIYYHLLTRLQSIVNYSHCPRSRAGLDGPHFDGAVRLRHVDERLVLSDLNGLSWNHGSLHVRAQR